MAAAIVRMWTARLAASERLVARGSLPGRLGRRRDGSRRSSWVGEGVCVCVCVCVYIPTVLSPSICAVLVLMRGALSSCNLIKAHHHRHRLADDEYDEGEEPEWAELDGVEDLPGGVGYSLRVATPSVFFKHIIGREGRTKANIERDTKCRIRIPPRGKEGDIGE